MSRVFTSLSLFVCLSPLPLSPLQHRCYIVCTCDKDLKRRIRKVPGVPIMFIAEHKFTVERMPEAFGAPK